jgi:iron complex outermembrane receptor protein/vitamin B12 transporter
MTLAQGASGSLCCLLLLLVPAATTAQDPPQSETDDGSEAAAADSRQAGRPVFVEELSVTARAREAGGGAVTVIDRAAIEASNARTVAELLGQAAGVQVLSFGARGGRSTARIRGGNANFTLVMLDGIPLNNPTDLEGGTFNLASLPLSHVERIEVIRGPQSYFFGSSAMAGAVNVVSRRGESVKPRVQAELEAGHASLLRSAAAISAAAGRGDYFLGVTWEEEEERIAEESFEQLNVQGNFSVPLGESTLRLTGRYTDWQADDYQDASGGPVFGTGELRSTDHRQGSLGLRWRNGGGGRWRHGFSGSADRQQAEIASPGVAPLVPPSVEDTTYTRLRLGWLTAVEPRAGLRVRMGADVEREEGENDSVLLLPPFLGGALSGDYHLERTTPAAFVETAAERGGLVVEAGLRADLPEHSGPEWSPRIGLGYRFADSGVLLRGTWSQAFKLPSFFALASPPELGGNPDLLPEKSTGVDLGVALESRSGAVSAALTLFHNRYRNLIDFDFDLFLHVNRSTVEADGVELSARWKPAGAVAIGADLYWQDLEDPGSDRPLLNQPEWIAAARLEWTLARSLRLWLGGRYTGGSPDVQIPVPERGAVDAYAVFNLAATWRWSPRWQLRARLDNLTDEDYEHFVGFPEPGRSLRVGVWYGSR